MATSKTDHTKLDFDTFWGTARNWHITAWSLVFVGLVIYTVMVFGAIFDMISVSNLTKFISITISGEALVVIGIGLFFVRDKQHMEQAKVLKTLSK